MGVEFALDSFYVYYTARVWKKSNLPYHRKTISKSFATAPGYGVIVLFGRCSFYIVKIEKIIFRYASLAGQNFNYQIELLGI